MIFNYNIQAPYTLAEDFMVDLKEDFIRFLVDSKLLFFYDGEWGIPCSIDLDSPGTKKIEQLSNYYSRIITGNWGDFHILDMIFSPIFNQEIMAAVSSELGAIMSTRPPYCYKEDGRIIGSNLFNSNKILVITDVIFDMDSVTKIIEDIRRETRADIAGLVAAIDFDRSGSNGKSVLLEVQEKFGVMIKTLVTFRDIVSCLQKNGTDKTKKLLAAMQPKIKRFLN